MPWDVFGTVGLLSLWAACGLLPWSAALILGRGRGALSALPLAVVAGIVGGLLTAAFAKDGAGFAVSLPAAMAASAVALVVSRRLVQGATADAP